MTDLIVFSVGENRYALDIENVHRIIQACELTNIPNVHTYIDGMMSYENKVIKVLNYRKLIGMQTFEDELATLFTSLKQAHASWVCDLRKSLETGCEFTKTLNPHACSLGKWIDSFTAYDDNVSDILNELVEYHKQLHIAGSEALEIYKNDKQKALVVLNENIENIYKHTMGALDSFINELDVVGNSLQKFIIYDNKERVFAIKVDTIEDIAHVQESEYLNSSDEHNINEYLELEGVLDLNDALINIIKSVKLPKQGS